MFSESAFPSTLLTFCSHTKYGSCPKYSIFFTHSRHCTDYSFPSTSLDNPYPSFMHIEENPLLLLYCIPQRGGKCPHHSGRHLSDGTAPTLISPDFLKTRRGSGSWHDYGEPHLHWASLFSLSVNGIICLKRDISDVPQNRNTSLFFPSLHLLHIF